MPSRVRALLLIAVTLFACGHGSTTGDNQAALQEANAAMKLLNDADHDFPDQFRGKLIELTSVVMQAPAKAKDILDKQIVPMLDGYLATLDAAVTASKKYLAVAPDPAVEADLAKIELRGKTMRAARDKVTAVAKGVADGSIPADQIATRLGAIGAEMLRPPK